MVRINIQKVPGLCEVSSRHYSKSNADAKLDSKGRATFDAPVEHSDEARTILRGIDIRLLRCYKANRLQLRVSSCSHTKPPMYCTDQPSFSRILSADWEPTAGRATVLSLSSVVKAERL